MDEPPPTKHTLTNHAVLVASFGTTHDDNREQSIGGIERALQAAFPAHVPYRAFTSHIVIDILRKRGTKIDTVDEALARIVADGATQVIIQPTTVMAGHEYDKLVDAANSYRNSFDSFAIGAPLLTTPDDFQAVARAVASRMSPYESDDTAIVLVGHGTNALSDVVYAELQDVFARQGHENYLVGTVEGTVGVRDTIAAATRLGVTKVVMAPLMVVAGDHAVNDIAGDSPTSWKSQFRSAGFQVRCVEEGLGQNPAIQRIYVTHAQKAQLFAAIGGGDGSSGLFSQHRHLDCHGPDEPSPVRSLGDGSSGPIAQQDYSIKTRPEEPSPWLNPLDSPKDK